MSRWTPKPHGPRDGDGDHRDTSHRDRSRRRDGSAEGHSTEGRRDRTRSERGRSKPERIGESRTGGGRTDRSAEGHDRLREPRSTDRYVRGRSRLTVRELMEQMNAGDTGPTQIIRPVAGPADPASASPAGPTSPPATSPSADPTPPPAADSDGPAADDRPTEVHRFGNDVTQKIPPVGSAAPSGVDLSDAATQKRVIEESRAQDSHPALFQPTPDLTGAIPVVAGPGDDVGTDAGSDASAPTRAAGGSGGGTGGPPSHRSGRSGAAGSGRPRPRRVGSRRSPQSALTHNLTVTGRILVSIACVTALLGTGLVWGYFKAWNGSWNTIAALDPDDGNIRNKNAQGGDENYLIVGTDTRSGQNAKVGAGTTADAEGARSDTIILVNIPANRSRVVAVSFPRDLQVDRPECQQWDNANGSYAGTLEPAYGVKLNSIYADGGPQCLVRVLTQMSGLNINHFIAMDFVGFEKVVRAVGGVEVCSTTPLYDYELGQILRKPGEQKLTGRRALNYVRARTISTEGNGDYGRIKRQQLFMSSLLRSTLSGNVLSNPSKLNSIVNTFIEYSFVDKVDTQSLLDLAESMQGIDAGRVTFLTIPTSGTATDGSNNEIPRTEDIDAIFNAIIDDKPLPGEEKAKQSGSSSTSSSSRTSASAPAPTPKAPPSKVTATAQNPGNVGVRILNGTGRAGEASDVSDRLTPDGFDVRGVADASENRSDTVIRYGPGEQDSAATLAEMFPGATIQLDRTVRSGVEVILGSDFTGSLATAPAAGSTLSVDQLPPAANNSNLPNDLAVTNAGDTTCS
ncbi:hypothetical protein GCM10009624_17070 [Gordonia sinesedis]